VGRLDWAGDPGGRVTVSYSPRRRSDRDERESNKMAASGQPPHESDNYTTVDHLLSRVAPTYDGAGAHDNA